MNVFTLDFVAIPETIDELGHVNNAIWVRWLQKIATSHWDAVAPEAHKAAYIWVVVRHEIDYLRALGPGQAVTGRTWVAEKASGAKFNRYTEFHNAAGQVHLRAKTSWALLDKASGRPLRVTDAIMAPFHQPADGWRAMTPADLDAVDRIAAHVHVDFPEPIAVFANRQALFPKGSFVFQQGGQILGYMLAHPWPSDRPSPDLGVVLERLPPAQSLYLHDIALLPEARGTGAGDAAVDLLISLAREQDLPHIWLTAVGGADHYWCKKGFQRVGQDRPYGEGSMVMDRMIDAI